LFSQLRHYFQYFKESYIRMNYIDDINEKIDIVRVIIDQNYSMMGDSKRPMVV